jgi:hypothetical protein
LEGFHPDGTSRIALPKRKVDRGSLGHPTQQQPASAGRTARHEQHATTVSLLDHRPTLADEQLKVALATWHITPLIQRAPHLRKCATAERLVYERHRDSQERGVEWAFGYPHSGTNRRSRCGGQGRGPVA